ncbi:AlpA family phage regulatory protein [Pasteurellaceae bacterium TAE3-ERU1]|nr:AlpA family phage regulatory protein [Pasteurellaceae bacterium TAE3-ERU1]
MPAEHNNTTIKPQLYSERDLYALLSIKRAALYRLIALKDFPKPFKLGRFNRWHIAEVQAWLEKMGGYYGR